MISTDSQLNAMLLGVLALLGISSIAAAAICRRRAGTDEFRRNLVLRIASWWVMAAIFAAAASLGMAGLAMLFALASFFAFREFVTLIATRRADHRALFWAFFFVIPLQYYLVYLKWYGLFAVFIPVYVAAILPIRIVVAGDIQGFLERTAKIQWGLLSCVYFVSHVPALLMIPLRGATEPAANLKLVLFLLIVVQLSDVFQYVWGKAIGRTPIAPSISPKKTVEGLLGGVATAVAIGTVLYRVTPFSIAEAAQYSLLIAIAGFGGGLVMSAVKRDRGVKDFGELIPGHGGMLDRFDSICFAAPLLFHVVRFFHSTAD